MSGMSATERRVLWGLVAVAFVLRFAWVLYAQAEPPTGFAEHGDQYSYFFYGTEIARGNGYVFPITGDATAYYPIGYPALLGVVAFILFHTPLPDDLLLAGTLLNVVMATASVGLVGLVGARLAGARAGLIAAGLLAAHPNMVFQVTTLQLETAFIFLVLVALALILLHEWDDGPPSRARLATFGLALGVAILVRPFAFVLLVGLAGALLAARTGWRRAVLGTALAAVVAASLSVPWTIRNWVQMDSFVPSSTNMGDTLCLDRNLDARGGFRWADHDGCADPTLPEVERNRANTRKAIEFVLDHPGRELLQIVRRADLMFASDHDGIEATQDLGNGDVLPERVVDVAEPVADGYFFVLLGLAILGLPQLLRPERRAERILVASGLTGLLVIPLLLWGNPRFHLPLAPFLALCAALAVDAAWRRVRTP